MCAFVPVSIKPCPVTHPSPFSAAYPSPPMGVEPSAAAWVTHQPRCYPLSSAAT